MLTILWPSKIFHVRTKRLLKRYQMIAYIYTTLGSFSTKTRVTFKSVSNIISRRRCFWDRSSKHKSFFEMSFETSATIQEESGQFHTVSFNEDTFNFIVDIRLDLGSSTVLSWCRFKHLRRRLMPKAVKVCWEHPYRPTLFPPWPSDVIIVLRSTLVPFSQSNKYTWRYI